MNLIIFLKSNIYRVLFLLILSFVLYSNSLNGEFVYDDMRTVVENTYLDSINSLFEIFTTISFWGEDTASRSYRPIATFSHQIINLIFKRNQLWFHLFNLYRSPISGWCHTPK